MNRRGLLSYMGIMAVMMDYSALHATDGNGQDGLLNGALPKKPEPIIPKGHQRFLIEGIEIYALNAKNAEKKFNKLKKLKR